MKSFELSADAKNQLTDFVDVVDSGLQPLISFPNASLDTSAFVERMKSCITQKNLNIHLKAMPNEKGELFCSTFLLNLYKAGHCLKNGKPQDASRYVELAGKSKYPEFAALVALLSIFLPLMEHKRFEMRVDFEELQRSQKDTEQLLNKQYAEIKRLQDAQKNTKQLLNNQDAERKRIQDEIERDVFIFQVKCRVAALLAVVGIIVVFNPSGARTALANAGKCAGSAIYNLGSSVCGNILSVFTGKSI